jgi:uncharacterized protein
VTTQPAPAPPPRRELLLYLLVGFGLFFVGTLGLASQVERVTLTASMALYAVNFISFAGTTWLLGIRRQGLSLAEFGLRPFPLRWLWIALLAALAIMPLRAAAALLVQWLAGIDMEALQPRLDVVAPDGPLALNLAVTLLGAGLLAPLAEEVYFRGLLHRWFWLRWPQRPWLRVAASSALFALGHFDSPGVAASSLFLGAICAIAYELSRSLWLPIAIHVVNNSLAVLLVYAALALAR